MNIRELTISHFRNIKQLNLKPSEQINLFYGDNAQGKTNILEAIYYLSTGRSFRAKQDSDCVPHNSGNNVSSIISAKINRIEGDIRIVIHLSKDEKIVTINQKKINKLSLLWGKFPTVLFIPDDIQIIKGNPQKRRRFLDTSIGQIHSQYLIYLQRYDFIIRERNALLKSIKDIKAIKDQISIWDKQLVEIGTEILFQRYTMTQKIAEYFAQSYNAISSSKENAELIYTPSFDKEFFAHKKSAYEIYKITLEENLKSDLKIGYTQIGPHRDDFDILLDGKSAKYFSSQGQQKSSILALKMAEIYYMNQEKGEMPVLLIDDLSSELDDKRLLNFLELLGEGIQTFITSIALIQSIKSNFSTSSFKIKNGEIT